MCQESLTHYLDNRLNSYTTFYRDFDSNQMNLFGNKYRKGQLKLTEEYKGVRVHKKDLEILIRKGHLALENDQRVLNKGRETETYKFQLPESVRKQAKAIDTALADIKVCDPAIGSGAFPVGLLHEIVNARLALAPHTGKAMSSYEVKRHAIAESLYGVDIDDSSIDIARLRLWLSLVVDEDNYDTIEALPNLDYKIVRGNSLIGFPEGWKSPSFTKVENLKRQFFRETDQTKKAELKIQIEHEIQQRFNNSKKVFGWQVDFDFRLYFSEVWHEKGGFDVVIGNPPYVQIQRFSGKQAQKDWEDQNFQTFAKTADIYCLFYEKGHRILRDRGVLAFVSSNKWMRAGYGKKLRLFFLSKTTIQQLIDFGDSPIFSEATTYTNILLFEKANKDKQPKAWDLSTSYRAATSLERMLLENPKGAALFTDDAFVILPPEVAAIRQRIETAGTPLKEWDVSIYRGILTGFNEAFIIDGKKKDELITRDPKSAEIIKPILRGRDIKRYRIDFANLWLINTHNGFHDVPPIRVDGYLEIKAYFEEIESRRANGELGKKAQKAKGLYARDDQGITPYNLRSCAYIPEFEKEKIVWLEMSPTPNFAISTEKIFVLNTSYILTGEKLKWILAIANSSVMDCYFPLISTDVRGKTRRYIKQYVEMLPIIPYEKSYAKLLEPLIDYVQLSKKADNKLQSAFFEQLIDGLVYELYFPDEIKAAGKEISPHLGELKPLTDNMRDEKKLAVIQRQFDRLYDPRHPVRNNLETLDSVSVVHTIREALQK